MAGDPRFSLHGWKQLVEWSFEHACLSVEQQKEGREYFAEDWEAFCEWIVEEYGTYAESLREL